MGAQERAKEFNKIKYCIDESPKEFAEKLYNNYKLLIWNSKGDKEYIKSKSLIACFDCISYISKFLEPISNETELRYLEEVKDELEKLNQ